MGYIGGTSLTFGYNQAASYAQQYFGSAAEDVAASTYRLSSGNRLNQASTDIAAMMIGTLLNSDIAVLQTAMGNAAQANSLLGVASGGLQQINSILQQQQSLATQALAGGLSSSQLGYLNQEFQSLSQQIDSIASTTNFNGINLLDGSLYTPVIVSSNTSVNSVDTAGQMTFVDGSTFTANSSGSSTDAVVLSVGGQSVTFHLVDSTDATGSPTDIVLSSATTTSGSAVAAAFYQAVQNTLSSANPAYATQKQILSGLQFNYSAGNDYLTVQSNAGGDIYNSGQSEAISLEYTTTTTNTGMFTVNNTAAVGTAVDLSAGGTVGTNGSLYAGSFPSTNGEYGGTATTIATGQVSNSILAALDTTDSATTGVNAQGISNNSAFTGTISGFTATYEQPGYVDLSLQVGNYTYTAANVATTYSSATTVRLSSVTPGGGYLDLNFNSTTSGGYSISAANQTDANNFAAALNDAFSGVTFYQNREINSYTPMGYVYPTGSSTPSGSLSNTSFNLISSNFDNIQLQNISVSAPQNGNASIQFTINGQVYQSGYNQYGSASPLGTSIANGATIGFVDESNPNNILVFTNNSGGAINISNTAEAQGLQKALQQSFGMNENAGLSVQVGSSPSDTINIQIPGVGTQNIYLNNSGVYQSIDIATTSDASTANTVLSNAINLVSAALASVGSMENQFNYASDTLETSVQNLSAASSNLMDTNVAEESSKLAESSVKLSASISMIAQANKLQQSLLNLLP